MPGFVKLILPGPRAGSSILNVSLVVVAAAVFAGDRRFPRPGGWVYTTPGYFRLRNKSAWPDMSDFCGLKLPLTAKPTGKGGGPSFPPFPIGFAVGGAFRAQTLSISGPEALLSNLELRSPACLEADPTAPAWDRLGGLLGSMAGYRETGSEATLDQCRPRNGRN